MINQTANPIKISRSKIEMFFNCPRCFYLDKKLKISQPPGYPFTLNNAVDTLLKKEFDLYRNQGEAHPLMKKYGINACPVSHEKIDEWRDALHGGIRFHHQKTNLLVTGGIDDLWSNDDGEFIIVDYKATSKKGTITLDAEWQKSYKRQMSVYAWLFRMNGYPVSKLGYFVYCNGLTDRDSFDNRLDFDTVLISYEIDDTWVENVLSEIRACLDSDITPEYKQDCKFCIYSKSVVTHYMNRKI